MFHINLPKPIIQICFTFLHPNEYRYCYNLKLVDFEGLNEEQILSIQIHETVFTPLIQQCVKMDMVDPLKKIEKWNTDLLENLVSLATEKGFNQKIMNYVDTLLNQFSEEELYNFNFSRIFQLRNVKCKDTYDWYCLHHLWPFNNTQTPSEIRKIALLDDDLEWFLLITKDLPITHILDIFNMVKYPMKIITWHIENRNCIPYIDTIFLNHYIDDLKHIYCIMKLNKSQELFINQILNFNWMKFIFAHFTILNDVESLFNMSPNQQCNILIAMNYNLSISDYCDFKQCFKLLSIEYLETIYSYQPELFHMNLTLSYPLPIEIWRFVMKHGSFITTPIVNIGFNYQDEFILEDFTYDEKFELSVIDHHIHIFLKRDHRSNFQNQWLSYWMIQRIPKQDIRFNQLFITGLGHIHWYNWMTDILYFVNWSKINNNNNMSNLAFLITNHLDHLVDMIDLNVLLHYAITNNHSIIKNIYTTSVKYGIKLNVKEDVIKNNWGKLTMNNKKALCIAFPHIVKTFENNIGITFISDLLKKKKTKQEDKKR